MDSPKPAMWIGGEPWWHFYFSYDFEGNSYEFSVCARSEAEAHARMKKIALARFDGQGCGGPIPLFRGGFLIPLIVWWRNAKLRFGTS